MKKKELKTCEKCGEHYFGDHCVGCDSNQYSHYNVDTSIKKKLLIAFVFLAIIGFILLNR